MSDEQAENPIMASDTDLDGIEVSFDKQAGSTTLSADEERRLARAAVAAALVAVRQLAGAAAEEPVKKAGGFADPRRKVRRPLPPSWRRR
ncbi:hypothetical protein [Brevibacterium luteolum]|uniref:Uncharacterized protein n=1 Tax=Brevibacterium luteolum TaxID=199591 RepID=A0A849ASS3_9MICO|nr:hypothetical protein [Brevibacterium luteolum]MBM7529125.1 hypothetical protein [Brevibacterium luteolum]NNG79917.1 hypothetical protein [Brevibacterium luteolum]